MSDDGRVGFAWAVAAVAFWATWFAASALQLPMLWYLPLEHRFVFAAQPAGLAMCMYGQLLLAGAVAAVSSGAVWWAVRRRSVGAAQVWLSVGWCALLLCFVIGYFAFALWGRTPVITIAPEVVDVR